MNNKEGKEGSWKRGGRRMKTKEGKEEPWKRGKQGMKNKAREAREASKRGKQTEGEMTNEVEKEKPWEKSQKLVLFSGLAFPLFRCS